MSKNKTILLTFDVEEFDLPMEYGIPISKELQLQISRQGLNTVLLILKQFNITATFFTTAYFAEHHPELMKQISETHEIASHMYHHTNHHPGDVRLSRAKLSDITLRTINGFRSPRLEKVSLSDIKNAGYTYDSSVNPTYLPGRYNNFFTNRKIHTDPATGIKIVPMSVTPLFRFPLFWLSFKNLNYRLYLFFCKWCLRQDGYLHLYFHPWEFGDLSQWEIPRVIKNHSGKNFTDRFIKLLSDLKSTASFDTLESFLTRNNFNK